jgi:hypothetical protein
LTFENQACFRRMDFYNLLFEAMQRQNVET